MSDPAREWIAEVCRQTREDHGFKRSEVAAAVKREQDVIRNFETLRGGWAPLTGAIVTAYAELAGVEPIDLWRRAINRWEAAQRGSAQPSAGQP